MAITGLSTSNPLLSMAKLLDDKNFRITDSYDYKQDRSERTCIPINDSPVFRKHIDELNSDCLPIACDIPYDIELLADFFWGPNYEWTGYVVPEDAHAQFVKTLTGRSSIRLPEGEFHFAVEVYIPHKGRFISMYEAYRDHSMYFYNLNFGAPSHDNIGLPMLARFSSYETLVDFNERRTSYHSTLYRDRAEASPALSLAGLLQNLHLNDAALTEWRTALADKKYQYGYGCLHAGDTVFDPLGVLADLNGCTWDWDEAEGAYKPQGADAYTLSEAQLREYLSLRKNASRRDICAFLTQFAALADQCCEHAQIAKLLEGAERVIQERRARVEHCRQTYKRSPMSIASFHDPSETMHIYIEPSYRRAP